MGALMEWTLSGRSFSCQVPIPSLGLRLPRSPHAPAPLVFAAARLPPILTQLALVAPHFGLVAFLHIATQLAAIGAHLTVILTNLAGVATDFAALFRGDDPIRCGRRLCRHGRRESDDQSHSECNVLDA